MYFDWLSDNIKDPCLVLFNVEIDREKMVCETKLLFIRAHQKEKNTIELRDKKENKILSLLVPKAFARLPKDIFLEKANILKIDKLLYGKE